MSHECLLKAKIGDRAKVCFKLTDLPYGGAGQCRPTPITTEHQIIFPIIDIDTSGWPIIGSPPGTAIKYGLSRAIRSKYPKYGGTYILYPSDIKVVAIYKDNDYKDNKAGQTNEG